MLFGVLIFLAAGLALGVIMGLLPGVHPNMVVLLVPLLAGLGLEPVELLTFLVSLGVSNVFIDFIPSILLSAPDSDSALATLPGQRMLAAGKGHEAVRLALLGAFAGIIITAAIIPVLIIIVPSLYGASKPVLWVVLSVFAAAMILRQRPRYKILWGVVIFFMAGAIGVASLSLPVDRTFILFPILTGLFGLPQLIIQARAKVTIPPQKYTVGKIEPIRIGKSAGLGTAGGILAGFLPGVGTSEIASLATLDHNDRSFLMTMGAIAASNILTSFLALWLIGNPRSGVAVAADQLLTIDFGLFLSVVFAGIAAAAICVPITLFLGRKTLGILERIDYVRLSQALIVMLLVAISVTTGVLGLSIAAACCALGIFTNILGIKRGILMGVLILPTILFFMNL